MADVTDAVSGVAEANIYVLFARLNGDGMIDAELSPLSSPRALVKTDRRLDIASGFSIEHRMPSQLEPPSGDFNYRLVGHREGHAGNVAVSDQNTASDGGECNAH